MEDIGLPPDYRSGYDTAPQCHVCHRYRGEAYIETCLECGKLACSDCLEETDDGMVCHTCWDGWDD